MLSGVGPEVIRLHFVVEGQTEETFVRDILAPELASKAIIADAHRITTGKKRGILYRGGFVTYEHLRRDLGLWMNQERNQSDARFTTMVDLYRLPHEFPGMEECRKIPDVFERVEFLESRLGKDLNDTRFVPYIQIHEFEGLLFSGTDQFSAVFPGSSPEVQRLRRIRDEFDSPEHINDGAETAPSKRICNIFPAYAKTSYGLTIAKAIGLARMREECKHFNNWIEGLLNLA
jgi:Domain of unknown function (DUF4276)